jgi:hypothetical protein
MEKLGKITKEVKQELKLRGQSKTSLQKLKPRNAELLRMCETGDKFITRFNFDYCADRYRNIETVRQGIVAKMVTLREIAETYNEKTPVLMLHAWLINLSMFMGFEITKQQARETAQYMFEELRGLSLPLVTILFKRIKKGRYGEFYGRFNGQKILIACSEFRNEYRKEMAWIENQKQLRML